MKPFRPYLENIIQLINSSPSSISESWHKQVGFALDGGAGKALRQLVPNADLQSSGAFFTGSILSEYALSKLLNTLDCNSKVLDPACGAGDLLLACAKRIAKNLSPEARLGHWEKHLFGRDIHSEFVDVAKARLMLSAVVSGYLVNDISDLEINSLFEGISVGSGLSDKDIFRQATHIVINPPYSSQIAPPDCEWATGKINSAALFMEMCLNEAVPGTRVAAILPDVLRSGERYRKWRELVSKKACIEDIRIYGRFAPWADVDVFLMDLVIGGQTSFNDSNKWFQQHETIGKTIKDFFKVSIGPVVDFRHPKDGPLHPFVVSRNLPAWNKVSDVKSKRRFSGKVLKPPFVVVKRTSRAADKYRAVATIIDGKDLVAVENHLIILTPLDGALERCWELLKLLQSSEANNWFNERIRCRHLTVSSLSDLPYYIEEK